MTEQQEILVDYDEEENFPQATVEEPQAEENVAGDKSGNKFAGGAEDDEEEDEPGHTTNEIASFKDFMLRNELTKAIVDCGFEHPSKVQRKVIPVASSGADVLTQAVSGMGKTAVFVISTLQAIDDTRNDVQALVLAHTRELSYQIFKEYKRFSKYMENVKLAVCIGGMNMGENIDELKKGPQIVIGTPGRIQALIRDRHLNLKHLKHFILDECDKMLEADMRRDVQEIFKLCPYEKQVMMFTATLTPELRATCKKFMTNPTEVLMTRNRLSLHGLLQHYVELKENQKTRKLGDLLDNLEFNQIVIFVKSVSRCKELESLLNELDFKSCSINSGMPQEERLRVFENFKNFKFRILVSTDVAARGIDIQRVNIVVNYDMPDDPATYLHRVGRAGRFGTKGLAVSFVSTEADKEILRQVQARFKAEMQPLPEELPRASEYMG